MNNGLIGRLRHCAECPTCLLLVNQIDRLRFPSVLSTSMNYVTGVNKNGLSVLSSRYCKPDKFTPGTNRLQRDFPRFSGDFYRYPPRIPVEVPRTR